MTDHKPIETTDTTSKTGCEPESRPNGTEAAAKRRARQAAQLRANLARRKVQSRDRAAEEEGL